MQSLKKLNLKEESTTKFQTGGPDGDLGSNCIKLSNDITLAIADSSGVLYDPVGINKVELLRLANSRISVRNFDTKLLTAGGFFIDVNDNNVTLPNGE